MSRPSRTRTQAGGRGKPRQPPSGTDRALQSALAAEQAAVYGYGVVGAYLTGPALQGATADWLAHQNARNTLEAMLRSRGTQPAAAAVAYQLPIQVQAPDQAVSLAILIEERIAGMYLSLVALSSPAIRNFGALQVQAAALRAATWRGSTVPFPGLPAAATSPRRRGGA
jgi:Domain of unknown function (DUF4439)